MRVRVRLFATYRELSGVRQLTWSGKEGATVGQLVEDIVRRFPRLEGYRETMLLAVNEAFADPSTRLRDGDDVALMPPVSGGSS
jgi:molybdopterin synthase catalytic subunit